MKKRAYENSVLKYKLLEKKRGGAKEIIWKLNPSQREFVESTLGFKAEPYLYMVSTRPFYKIREVDPLLREIHYKHKKGIGECVLKLNSEQRGMLGEYGVKCIPYKYKISLA